MTIREKKIAEVNAYLEMRMAENDRKANGS